MATMITDPKLEESLKAERRASGADRYDEVWEGIYMMAPMPNDEHQEIVSRMVSILEEIVGWPGLAKVRPGVNVSDRKDDWQQNYRVPDVAVFLQGGRAKNCGAYWLGGPDFAIEVVSPEDQTREKIPFYEQAGVQELLVIDRAPWALELMRNTGSRLELAGRTELGQQTVLECETVPLSFSIAPASPRPSIEVTHRDSGKQWRV